MEAEDQVVTDSIRDVTEEEAKIVYGEDDANVDGSVELENEYTVS